MIAVGAAHRTAYFEAEVPADVAAAIEEAYRRLGGPDAEVVVGGAVADDQLDEFLTARTRSSLV